MRLEPSKRYVNADEKRWKIRRWSPEDDNLGVAKCLVDVLKYQHLSSDPALISLVIQIKWTVRRFYSSEEPSCTCKFQEELINNVCILVYR